MGRAHSPVSRSGCWGSDGACSLHLLALAGDKGDGRGAAVGRGWGQVGSRTVSPRHFGRSTLCPGLHHTTGKLSLSFPSSGRAVKTQGSLFCLQHLEERKSQSPWHERTGSVTSSGWAGGCQGTAAPGPTGLRWSSRPAAALRSDALWGTFPAPHSSPGSAPHPPHGPPSWRCPQGEILCLIPAQMLLPAHSRVTPDSLAPLRPPFHPPTSSPAGGTPLPGPASRPGPGGSRRRDRAAPL